MTKPDILLDRQQHEQLTSVLGEMTCCRLRLDRQKVLIAGVESEELADFSLAPAEAAVFSGFRLAKRRTEWLAGRIAAKSAAFNLLAASDRDFKRLTVFADEHGRPMLQNACSGESQLPEISISHSGSQVVAVAAWQPCGIDVQEITPQLGRVRERFAIRSEEEVLSSIVGDGDQMLLGLGLLWTAKEALRKVFGVLPLPGFHEFSLARAAGDPQRMAELYFQPNLASGAFVPPVCAFVLEGYAFACTVLPRK